MRMLLTRRAFNLKLGLAGSLTAAGALRAAGNTHVRAGCVVTAGNFDALLTSLKEVQKLGYSGYSTTMRLLQTQSGHMEEMRAQLSENGLDLIGVRASLPKYAEDGADRALEDLSRLAMATRQFGGRSLFVHSPGLAPDGKFKPQDLDAKAKFFDQCAKRCRETGVIFTYRTQEAEFQNDAAEITGLVSMTDKRNVYYDLDLTRAEGITFFRDNPGRTFAMEAAFGDSNFKAHELAAAVKHTKWISWLIDAKPDESSRAAIKKAFSI